MRTTSQRAFSVIELLITSAILVSVVTAASAALQGYARLTREAAAKTQASLMAEEAAEALWVLRDEAWSNVSALSSGTTYYLAWNGTAYAATTTSSSHQGLTRTITVAPAERDASDRVAATGTEDSNTIRATITVTREGDGEEILTTEMLIHNLFESGS